MTSTFLHCRDARRKAPVRESASEVKEADVRWFLHPDRQPKVTQESRKVERTAMGKFKGH